jgi:hypothetical protein
MHDPEKSLEERVEMEKDFDAIIDAIERLPLVKVRVLTVDLLLRVMAQVLEDDPSPAGKQFIPKLRKRAALLAARRNDMNKLETKPYAKAITVSEAVQAARTAAHLRTPIAWSDQLRDELEQELEVFTNKLSDALLEKHFAWAVEVALGMLAPITIMPDPEEEAA